MQIKALQAIVIRNPETGDLMSIAYGTVADVPEGLGNMLISDGIAEAYSGGGGSQTMVVLQETEIVGEKVTDFDFYATYVEIENPVQPVITVVFDGVRYELAEHDDGLYGGGFDRESGVPIFTEYPFGIGASENDLTIMLPDDSKHTIFITAVATPIIPRGTYYIDRAGVYDVTQYAKAEVSMLYGSAGITVNNNSSKSVTVYACCGKSNAARVRWTDTITTVSRGGTVYISAIIYRTYAAVRFDDGLSIDIDGDIRYSSDQNAYLVGSEGGVFTLTDNNGTPVD